MVSARVRRSVCCGSDSSQKYLLPGALIYSFQRNSKKFLPRDILAKF